MIILDNPISREELSHWAECIYGDMIKGWNSGEDKMYCG